MMALWYLSLFHLLLLVVKDQYVRQYLSSTQRADAHRPPFTPRVAQSSRMASSKDRDKCVNIFHFIALILLSYFPTPSRT